MRDPDLVLRAQRAAAALERAWDRHRTLHGLGADPMPPISSYVGYSLEEPWGQPRVVFGVAAEEAEQLAIFLDGHDGARPAARPAAGPGQADAGAAGAAGEGAAMADVDQVGGNGRVHVPEQPQPVSAKRVRSKEQSRSERPRGGREQPRPAGQPADPRDLGLSERGRPDPGRSLQPGGVPESSGVLDPDRPGGLHALPPRRAGLVAVPGDADLRGDTDLTAFRPRHEPASYLDEGPEPDPFFAGPDERTVSGRVRGGRGAGSHAMPRQKRPNSSGVVTDSSQRAGRLQDGGGRLQDGGGRRGITSMAAELAGWASGELPGQAAHRFAPHPASGQYSPAGDTASRPNGGLTTDGGI
jgi:hypothetical protein